MDTKSILIVEDDGLIAEDVRLSVERLGYTVVASVGTGEDAIKSAATLRPDIVLMDIVLRGHIDGIKAASHISSSYNIPVVYLTSHSDKATIKRARETGPFGYVIKPFNEKELSATLDMALYKHSMDRRLKENEQWLSIILNSIGDAVIVTMPDRTVGFMNPAAEMLTGWSGAKTVGRPVMEVLRLVDEESVAELDVWFGGLLDGRDDIGPRPEHIALWRSGGDMVSVNLRYTFMKDAQGRSGGAVIVLTDVTEQRRAIKLLRESEQFLSTTFDSIRDPFCIIDRDYRIVRANEAYARSKNMPLTDVLMQKCFDILRQSNHACPECIVRDTFESGMSLTKEKPYPLPGGQTLWREIFTYPILNESGRVGHVIEYSIDISGRKEADQERHRLISELEHLSRVDALTGILNRRALMEFAETEVERSRRYGRHVSIILCDIDRFKDINDTYGHGTGDEALKRVAEVIGQMVRITDVFGRYGGDEFMLIMPETPLPGGREFAERLRAAIEALALKGPDGEHVAMSLSLGVASLEGREDRMDNIITRADAALYASKKQGRNRVSALEG